MKDPNSLNRDGEKCDLCEKGIEHVSHSCYNYAGHTLTRPLPNKDNKKEEEAKAKLLEYIWGSKKEQDFARKVWDLMLLEQEHNPMGIIKTYWKDEKSK